MDIHGHVAGEVVADLVDRGVSIVTVPVPGAPEATRRWVSMCNSAVAAARVLAGSVAAGVGT